MTQTEPEIRLVRAPLMAGEVQKTLLRSEPTEPLIVRIEQADGSVGEGIVTAVRRYFQPGRGWLTFLAVEERPDEFHPLPAAE